MKVLNKSTKHHVNAAWLKSELFRMREKLRPHEIALIESTNTDNPEENNAREFMLNDGSKFGRSAIIDKLPQDLEWHEVEIEENDIGKLYLIPVFDWFVDTGGTFRLDGTINHLAPGRGHLVNVQTPQPVIHFEKLDAISKDKVDTDGIVIISTNSENGPYTIIDGTHRSSMLIRQNKLAGTKAFLGISKDLSQCIWSVERADFQQYLNILHQWVQSGIMW